MTIYSAYLPPAQSTAASKETFKLVPDTTAPLALIFPPFWLAWNRLWLELLAYLVFAICIILLAVWQASPLIGYLSTLPGFYLLLEGHELVRYRLERKGWQFLGVVDASNMEEAELRFVVDHEADFSNPKKSIEQWSGIGATPKAPIRDAVGLFPE